MEIGPKLLKALLENIARFAMMVTINGRRKLDKEYQSMIGEKEFFT